MHHASDIETTSSGAACGHMATANDAAVGDEPSCPEIEVQTEAGAQHIDIAHLQAHLISALPHVASVAGRPVGRIGVTVVSDARMAKLHGRHLGEFITTDVLTFDQSNPGAGTPIVAEIVVCADEAARRSAEFGHPIERELLLYVVHGLLHCAGFDDHDETQAAAMHAEEDRILQAIGVGATFQPHRGRPS